MDLIISGIALFPILLSRDSYIDITRKLFNLDQDKKQRKQNGNRKDY